MALLGKAIASKLSTVNSNRVYPNQAPQTIEDPVIIYYIVDTVPVNEKQGAAPVDVSRVQISIYAHSYAEVDSLAADVRTVMDNIRNKTVSGVNIIISRFDDQSDQYDEKARKHQRNIDYIIRVKN